MFQAEKAFLALELYTHIHAYFFPIVYTNTVIRAFMYGLSVSCGRTKNRPHKIFGKNFSAFYIVSFYNILSRKILFKKWIRKTKKNKKNRPSPQKSRFLFYHILIHYLKMSRKNLESDHSHTHSLSVNPPQD